VVQRRVASIARGAVGRTRQVVVVVFALVIVVGLVVVDRRAFGELNPASGQLSSVPEFRRDAKASTWFCPGVIGNDASVGGSLVIANAGETPVGGTITRFLVDGAARKQRFAVPARSRLEVDALGDLSSPFVSALVESQGAAVAVEQRTTHRAGDAVASCASAPAGTWYLADGFTGSDRVWSSRPSPCGCSILPRSMPGTKRSRPCRFVRRWVGWWLVAPSTTWGVDVLATR
jgi:hypothetical protein